MLFGTAENRAMGIAGEVDLVAPEDATAVLRLRGRFWHRRADVLAREAAFLAR